MPASVFCFSSLKVSDPPAVQTGWGYWGSWGKSLLSTASATVATVGKVFDKYFNHVLCLKLVL